ncbi:pentapeptide repeat-containing protein [Aquipuribacter sp. MA13-6]|uniref:pentapeptide repeat-containing protein n=1 Tax=unclassified Aquipuribacter TaxID=2635084 RepID=UPI003EEB33EA
MGGRGEQIRETGGATETHAETEESDGAAQPAGERDRRPVARWVTVLLTITGVVLAMAIGWLSFAVLPALLYPVVPGMEMDVDEVGDGVRAEVEIARLGYQAETRTAVTQLLIGITGLSAALLAWQQFQRTKEKERAEAHLASRQLQLTREKEQEEGRRVLLQGHLALLGKAMEMLSNKSSAVRIGGLFSLDSLARQSEEHRPACAAALSAYIREQRGGAMLGGDESEGPVGTSLEDKIAAAPQHSPDADVTATKAALERWGRNSGGLPADVETALELLMGFVKDFGDHIDELNLSNADLCLANLEGVTLDEIDLTGSQLRGAYLNGVSLARARLVGTDLRDAVLIDVRLDGAVCGRRTEVEGATFWGVSRVGVSNDEDLDWPEDRSTPKQEPTFADIDRSRGT